MSGELRDRPPRPPMSDATPPPALAPAPLTGPVGIARLLWGLSFLCGFLVLGVAFLDRIGRMNRLADFITGNAPGYDQTAAQTIATWIFWGALFGLALFLFAEAALRGVSERRPGFRWVLLTVVLAHIAVAVLADAFIALGPDTAYPHLLLIGQLGLALLALATTGFVRSSAGRRRSQVQDAG